jgi:hypothetical protein
VRTQSSTLNLTVGAQQVARRSFFEALRVWLGTLEKMLSDSQLVHLGSVTGRAGWAPNPKPAAADVTSNDVPETGTRAKALGAAR